MVLGTRIYNFYQMQQTRTLVSILALLEETCESYNPPSLVTCLLVELGLSDFLMLETRRINCSIVCLILEAHKIQFKAPLRLHVRSKNLLASK